jgi:predicted N-acyltransferase
MRAGPAATPSCPSPSCTRCTNRAAPARDRLAAPVYGPVRRRDAGRGVAAVRQMHSYGEYVFDWAWADAYHRNGVEYYPKLLSAIPVHAGDRAAPDGARRRARRPGQVLRATRRRRRVVHPHPVSARGPGAELGDAGFMLRSGVQFHWLNAGYADFDAFLATLEQEKAQEHPRRTAQGARGRRDDAPRARPRRDRGADWRFFNRCYQRTYAAHHSTPYLNLDFFRAHRAHHAGQYPAGDRRAQWQADRRLARHPQRDTLLAATGANWNTCPACTSKPPITSRWNFASNRRSPVFEGGAQGEHKMARGFLPTRTWSAHWLAHPAFADAIERFLAREKAASRLTSMN